MVGPFQGAEIMSLTPYCCGQAGQCQSDSPCRQSSMNAFLIASPAKCGNESHIGPLNSLEDFLSLGVTIIANCCVNGTPRRCRINCLMDATSHHVKPSALPYRQLITSMNGLQLVEWSKIRNRIGSVVIVCPFQELGCLMFLVWPMAHLCQVG